MKSIVRFASLWSVKCLPLTCLAEFLLAIIPQVRAQVYLKVPDSGGTTLYRYDIPTNKWATGEPLPAYTNNDPAVNYNARIITIYPLYADSVNLYTNGYVDAKVGFRRLLQYSPANGWKVLTDKKPLLGTGPVFTPTGTNFYYYSTDQCVPFDSLNPGCTQDYLFRESLTNNTITRLTPQTPSVLITSGKALYAINGTSFKLWDESNQIFLPKADAPGSLTKNAVGIGNYIYVLGEADQVYRYSITTNTWTTLPGVSPVVFDPIRQTSGPPLWSITTDGKKIYATASGYSFYAYDLTTNTWEVLPRLPAILTNPEAGENLVYLNNPCPSTQCIPVVVSRLR